MVLPETNFKPPTWSGIGRHIPVLLDLLRAELVLKLQVHLGQGVDERVSIGRYFKHAYFTAYSSLTLPA